MPEANQYRLLRDGSIGQFRPGLSRILNETPVPVIPIAIVGPWASMFSRYGRKLRQRLPRKLWHRVVVKGEYNVPEKASPEGLHEQVLALYGAA